MPFSAVGFQQITPVTKIGLWATYEINKIKLKLVKLIAYNLLKSAPLSNHLVSNFYDNIN